MGVDPNGLLRVVHTVALAELVTPRAQPIPQKTRGRSQLGA